MHVLTVDFAQGDWGKMLAYSLRDTGFARLVNAPVNMTAVQRLYVEWAVFFAGDEKYDSPSDPDKPEGYLPYRTRNGRLIDLKESFYFHLGCVCPLQLCATTEAVYHNLMSVAQIILHALVSCKQPGLPTAFRPKLGAARRGAVLRIIHYPPLTGIPEAGDHLAGMTESVRLGSHKDLNLLTLLPAATVPGLEIKDNEGEWHRIECHSNETVVNAGDELQRISRGHYRSTEHRVRNDLTELRESRYAAAFFLAEC